MSVWEHWHPAALSDKLGKKPLGVRIAGREIVLFRTAQGAVGALDDVCPHRRMRLSLGAVRDEKLVCMYHGWCFDRDGSGESPGTPKLHARACHFEVAERFGAIWVRAASSENGRPAEPPAFEVDGYRHLGNLFHVAKAPLELVVDNFTEVEHTPTTHALLGYEMSRMAEVETKVESTPTSVRVFNAGPQKRISPVIERLFGIRAGDRFVDDWTTRFAPVHSVYDQYWSDPATLVEKGLRFKIYVFFTPLDAETTALTTFTFVKEASNWQTRLALLPPSRPILMKIVGHEVDLDMRMLENLADKRPGIEGMKLSRFDKTLGLHRERIDRVYRGAPTA